MATETMLRSLCAPTLDGGSWMMRNLPSISPISKWHYALAISAEGKLKIGLMTNKRPWIRSWFMAIPGRMKNFRRTLLKLSKTPLQTSLRELKQKTNSRHSAWRIVTSTHTSPPLRNFWKWPDTLRMSKAPWKCSNQACPADLTSASLTIP